MYIIYIISSQWPKFPGGPSSQVAQVPGGPSSQVAQVPRCPSSRWPKFPVAQVPRWPKFPGAQVPGGPSSRWPKFPVAEVPSGPKCCGPSSRGRGSEGQQLFYCLLQYSLHQQTGQNGMYIVQRFNYFQRIKMGDKKDLEEAMCPSVTDT